MRAPSNLASLFGQIVNAPDPMLHQVAIPDRFYEGLNPDFASRLRALDESAPPGIFEDIGAISGFRSNDHQARLYAGALERYGDETTARRWVAPPGSSRHNYGLAMDLTYGSPEAREWVHSNAGNFGLHFPMDWENWHIEPVGADGGRVPLGERPQLAGTPQLGFSGAAAGDPGAINPGLAAMFGLDVGALGSGPLGTPGGVGGLPMMARQQQERRRDEEDETQRRRQALFGAGGLADTFS